jgi:dTDP-glucose 4,6-dehydratase
MTYLVTGGAGFIGSAVARLLVQSGETVVVVDKLTYAADLRTLNAVSQSPHFFSKKPTSATAARSPRSSVGFRLRWCCT